MRIQEVSHKTGITKRNIHYYIKQGIITPKMNPANGYYDFSEEDCQKLVMVRYLRNADFPVSAIHSIITNPLTASYYLNQHAKKLQQEIACFNKIINSLQYMMEHLSLEPDFEELFSLGNHSGLNKLSDSYSSERFDQYDLTFINRFLWGGFLPEGELTEYQKFLWAKLQQTTLEHPSEDYRSLYAFIKTLNPSVIDSIFSQKNERHRYIANLDEKEKDICISNMVSAIEDILEHPEYIRLWKEIYPGYFRPFVRIQASELSRLVYEFSPLYHAYLENITDVCERLYQYLRTASGAGLSARLHKALDGSLDIENANHGELEALFSLPESYIIF